MVKRPQLIKQSLLHHIFWRSRSPVSAVAKEFAVTAQAVQSHLKKLVTNGTVVASGVKRYTRYRLAVTREDQRVFPLDGTVTEDLVWKTLVAPFVAQLPQEERDICNYGLTEMFNNAIDHSSGKEAKVSLQCTPASIVMHVADDGEGIFHKIANALKLTDPRQSLLELSKGKFTTDPTRHTGEGIFFSSRLFDLYRIRSENLVFYHSAQTDDWLLEAEDKTFYGTRITMALLLPSKTVMRDVFSRFSSGPDEYRFSKTHVPLNLATFDDEALLSRSSAKRVLSRVDRFSEVLLDFAGIRSIGQAFADEIFRVFANAHPKVQLIAINANADVTRMIRRAEAARSETASPPSP
jgi:anti-sigma regulatory factor (Ser/Thr protein kinase)